MDISIYILSGVIEDYCLGMLNNDECAKVEQMAALHPEVRQEIYAFQNALEKYAVAEAKHAPAKLKKELFNKLDNLSKESSLSLNNLPLLNKYSNHKSWLQFAKTIIPPSLNEEMYIKVLRNDEQALQSIVWIKKEYPDEVHDSLKECFIVLEGECECHIGGKVIKLGPGGFLDIPLHEHHDVKVISGPVLAVVQRIKVA